MGRSVWGLRVRGAPGAESPVFKPVDVQVPGLPGGFDGFTIAQISDLHVGPTIGRDKVESLVSEVNRRQPDLVAITGDLVDGSVAQLADAVAPLGDLSSPQGTFFL